MKNLISISLSELQVTRTISVGPWPQQIKGKGKVVRSIAMRERLMADLELGNTSLISYQQAVGGSLSRSDRATVVADAELDPSILPLLLHQSVHQCRLARRGNLMHLTVLVGQISDRREDEWKSLQTRTRSF